MGPPTVGGGGVISSAVGGGVVPSGCGLPPPSPLVCVGVALGDSPGASVVPCVGVGPWLGGLVGLLGVGEGLSPPGGVDWLVDGDGEADAGGLGGFGGGCGGFGGRALGVAALLALRLITCATGAA